MIWISVDPGDVTGLLSVTNAGDVIDHLELSALDAVRYVVEKVRIQHGRITVVVEGVTLPNKTHIPEITVKYGDQFGQIGAISALHYLSLDFNFELIPQMPHQRKLITLPMLQKLGWYFPSPDSHMVDAGKHLAVAWLRKGKIKMENLV